MQSPEALNLEQQVRALYQRAQERLDAGRAAEAEALCRAAAPEILHDPNIMCLMGEAALRLRRASEAKRWYGNVLKKYPDMPRALEGLGLALLSDGQAKLAVDYLQKAAATVPNRAATRFALGRALASCGHVAEAEQAFEKALELDPTRASLAKAAKAQQAGQTAEAEKLLRQALKENPESISALRMLGNLALDAGRWKQGLKLLEKAVELAPEFIMGWNDLANAYMRQDMYEEALEKVQQALSLDASHPPSRVMKGSILMKAQRFEEALEVYKQVLDAQPKNGGALSGMGHVLKTIGRQEESIEAYRRCIEAHPGFGEAYWSLANLKTFRFSTEEADQMMQVLESGELPDESRVNIQMALGKHFENEEDFDRAFEFYERANELRRRHEIYDPVQTQVIHDRIIKVFSEEFLAEHKGWGDPDPSPILIVGLPRSGSTLIEQILASHSMVEGTQELPDLGRMIGKLNKRRQGGEEYPESVLGLTADDARALGKSYLDSTQRYRTGKPRFIDKMPNNFPSIGLLKLILPNAKVINARRHPLDSCLGSYKQLFFKGQSWSYDQFEIAEYYLQYQRMMDHWHEVMPGQVLDVHYEEMVSDQETQTRRILDYLGLPFEEQCLRFYETERAVNTASSEQVRQPIYTKAVHFWRNYEHHLGEMIEGLEPLLAGMPFEEKPESMQGPG